MDQEYDMMRSARDARYLYIRNFEPELPYAGHIIYRNQSAIMQEWLRLRAEGTLTGGAALWMRTNRPAEELYDTKADLHQIRNLADEPAHRATLERMRKAVIDWMARIGDQGPINEAEMIQRIDDELRRRDRHRMLPHRSVRRAGAARCAVGPSPAARRPATFVPTQGASIGYTTEDGPAATWKLYTGPILVKSPMTLRAKAIRYSYRESAETRMVFTK